MDIRRVNFQIHLKINGLTWRNQIRFKGGPDCAECDHQPFIRQFKVKRHLTAKFGVDLSSFAASFRSFICLIDWIGRTERRWSSYVGGGLIRPRKAAENS